MDRERRSQVRDQGGATKLLTLTAIALVMGIAPASAQNAKNQAQEQDTQT